MRGEPNGMTGFWNWERALREAGAERRWYYLAPMHGWVTRHGLHVVLEANPVRVRVAGVHGGVIEFGNVPDALDFIDEDPLPPLPVQRAEVADTIREHVA